MKNLFIKTGLYLAFSIALFISCKHEPLYHSSDPCSGITINVSGTVVNASSASASDGSITVEATGGNDFTYSLNNGPYQASAVFSNLPVGSYSIIARSNTGCIGSAQFVVGNGDPCANVNITITAAVTNTTSPTSTDGSINAVASGSSSFQYKLNNGSYQSSGIFSGLATGTYTVTAKNSNGCTGLAQFGISAGNVCASKNIVPAVSTTSSDKCSPTGTITVTATGSTGFTYQLNGGAYQLLNVFSNLAPGSYTITVKDADNCTKSVTASIGVVNAGPLFNNVRTLIMSQCKPCHVNGGNNGGVNFDNDCTIVLKKDRIKARAVDGNPSPMPLNGSLTAAQKKIITDWINAGGQYSN